MNILGGFERSKKFYLNAPGPSIDLGERVDESYEVPSTSVSCSTGCLYSADQDFSACTSFFAPWCLFVKRRVRVLSLKKRHDSSIWKSSPLSYLALRYHHATDSSLPICQIQISRHQLQVGIIALLRHALVCISLGSSNTTKLLRT